MGLATVWMRSVRRLKLPMAAWKVQELLLATLVVGGILDDIHDAVPDDVGDIHADTFSHQGVAALLVDHGTLLVHHVIVLNQALTDTEVVLLDLEEPGSP